MPSLPGKWCCTASQNGGRYGVFFLFTCDNVSALLYMKAPLNLHWSLNLLSLDWWRLEDVQLRGSNCLPHSPCYFVLLVRNWGTRQSIHQILELIVLMDSSLHFPVFFLFLHLKTQSWQKRLEPPSSCIAFRIPSPWLAPDHLIFFQSLSCCSNLRVVAKMFLVKPDCRCHFLSPSLICQVGPPRPFQGEAASVNLTNRGLGLWL